MALLTLENLGKIYVSEGAVAVGIRGVNLSFDAGEFVAVTGKSGSGKTTLLNAISGIDTYEEGELYIDGRPTSHYVQSDWEAYREKYISFIFQDYNIIDSFTVLQNAELALMYIPSARERRQRALQLIERVGMTPYRHHRGSKLSGGQKQRTVIARALAKDSPIILADEPTGNLDSASAKEVVALLKEISSDKLVIVVTHNFEQFADCATREIRVFDGQIERDERIRQTEIVTPRLTDVKPATRRDTLRRGFVLGWHRFCATPRLTTFICFVMLLALLGTFALTSYLIAGNTSDEKQPVFGYAPGRLVVARHDGAPITEGELRALAKLTGAERMIQYDALLDENGYLYRAVPGSASYLTLQYRFSCNIEDITSHPERFRPDAGTLPTADDEVFLYVPISWERIYGRGELKAQDISVLDSSKKLTVTGVKYYYDNTETGVLYMTPDAFTHFGAEQVLNRDAYTYRVLLPRVSGSTTAYRVINFSVIALDNTLSTGTIAVATYDDDTFSWMTDDAAQINVTPGRSDSDDAGTVRFHRDGIRVDLARSGVLSEDMKNNGYGYDTLFVSRDLWDEVYAAIAGEYRQGSLFFTDDRAASNAGETLAALTEDMVADLTTEEKAALDTGYFALTSDVYHTSGEQAILGFFTGIFRYAAWILLILFLGLFLTLCFSRGMNALRGDLGILRSMGISADAIRVASYAQTFYCMAPAIVILAVVATVLYRLPVTNSIFPFMKAWHYVLILLGALFLCVRVARRYNRKVFSQSVRKTLRGGAAND